MEATLDEILRLIRLYGGEYLFHTMSSYSFSEFAHGSGKYIDGEQIVHLWVFWRTNVHQDRVRSTATVTVKVVKYLEFDDYPGPTLLGDPDYQEMKPEELDELLERNQIALNNRKPIADVIALFSQG